MAGEQSRQTPQRASRPARGEGRWLRRAVTACGHRVDVGPVAPDAESARPAQLRPGGPRGPPFQTRCSWGAPPAAPPHSPFPTTRERADCARRLSRCSRLSKQMRRLPRAEGHDGLTWAHTEAALRGPGRSAMSQEQGSPSCGQPGPQGPGARVFTCRWGAHARAGSRYRQEPATAPVSGALTDRGTLPCRRLHPRPRASPAPEPLSFRKTPGWGGARPAPFTSRTGAGGGRWGGRRRSPQRRLLGPGVKLAGAAAQMTQGGATVLIPREVTGE